MDPPLVPRRSRPTRATARRATTEAADTVDPINPTDKEKIRRARKRATDRQSQRDHRERQRIYIRQLEETVQSYKDAFSSDGSSDLAALLKENEKLQARCTCLEAALARIKNLASAVHVSDDVCCGDQDPQNFFARNPQQVSVSTSPSAELDSPGPSDGLLHVGQPVSDAGVMDVTTELPPHEMDHFDISCDGTAVFDTTMPLANRVQELGAGDDLDRCIASMVDGTATDLSLVPDSVAMRTPLLTEPAMPTGFNEALPTHPSFPKLSHSMGKWDEILLGMVDEARLQHRRGQFGTSEPSLRSLLSDKSTDILAYRLFHHISYYQSIPLHILLSVFWVQYLSLRWYVLGTQAAFLRIPEFMRPTGLEKRIQHRPCIGMLVWPDLRRALIRDSHTVDPERIGIELIEHMDTTWSPTTRDRGDLIGSTDVFAMIEHQAQRMETWKVDRRFQEKYAQFADCQLG
ncbi:bZIP transcription factor [Aspergillus candidus]|uniref:BZIP domain-containing protein n=1 Tax=Aspergillus candidus TaxID=41067 RepID=A0A2I2FKS1_ASPCN|nr:hypothetical protein BDW47DRAFT_122801 [Aspergillus candidus]PLB41238.1 hypothetical protein BDW47DRAFT_122801 [Aspergillus candidus]